jgi:hypothetical protein
MPNQVRQRHGDAFGRQAILAVRTMLWLQSSNNTVAREL